LIKCDAELIKEALDIKMPRYVESDKPQSLPVGTIVCWNVINDGKIAVNREFKIIYSQFCTGEFKLNEEINQEDFLKKFTNHILIKENNKCLKLNRN
jgi:hypothetical protein